MTLSFRNVDFDPTRPMDEWPAEAIATVIERGSLSDWRQVADAIRHSPWGPAARTAESVVAWGEHYGVDELIGGVIRRAREEVSLNGRARYAAALRAWRAERGMTLRRYAELAGTSATRLSAYEHGRVAPTTDVMGRLEHVYRLGATGLTPARPRGSAAVRARPQPGDRGSRR